MAQITHNLYLSITCVCCTWHITESCNCTCNCMQMQISVHIIITVNFTHMCLGIFHIHTYNYALPNLPASYFGYNIKTHDSESRGQEEAGYT